MKSRRAHFDIWFTSGVTYYPGSAQYCVLG
jgi:hypothetical protein